jgi:hypothetical protein
MRTVVKAGTMATLAAVWVLGAAPLGAQQVPAPAQKTSPPAKVDIVVERYLVEKKVSSLPYSIWLGHAPQDPARVQASTGSVRIGVQVPIGTTTQTSTNGTQGTTRTDATTKPEYQDVGTSIDCYLSTYDDGRFWLSINLRDTSIFDAGGGRQAPTGRASAASSAGSPAFRTFSFNNTMPMRDGQTVEFVNAADKVTGEIVKATATLTIVK